MQENTLLIDVVQGDQVVEQRRFDPARRRPLKIGSLRSADICVPGVARIHAVLTSTGNEVALVAMDQRSGVVHNGVRMMRAVVADGDEITIGETTRLSIRSHAVAVEPAPLVVPPPVSAPRFDPGARTGGDTQRITREEVERPAVESHAHPALPPEAAVTPGHRALEMRTYLGQALLDIHHYVDQPCITIGENRKADVFLSSEGLPAELFPLIRLDGDDYVLTFTCEMEGEIEIDGELWTLAQLGEGGRVAPDPELPGCFQLRLSLSTRALLHWGGVSFTLRFVAPPRALRAGRFQGMDHNYLNTLALSVAMVSTMVLTMLVYPIHVGARTPERLPDIIFTIKPRPFPWPEPEPVRPPDPPAARPSEPRPNSGSTTVVRAPRERTTPATDVPGRIRSFLAETAGGLLAGGSTPPSLGIDTRFIGSRGDYATGPGPAGNVRGEGPGLGRFGRRRQAGPIVTRPCLPGRDCAASSSLGSPRFGRHTDSEIGPGKPVVYKEGSLPKDLIQAVIDRSKGQIRACYERELQRDHKLEGRVAVRWIIAATGRVVRVIIVDNTMGNREVARCISERIRDWVFPSPAGGGIVEVSYPFVFRSI